MTLEEARKRLRAAPLADFVRVRRAIADELRADGEPRLAKLVATEKKPTRVEWALAQVGPRLGEELEAARERAASAQEHASGDALRAALSAYQRAVMAVIDAAKAAMREAGMPVTTTQERAMRAALESRAEDPLDALPKARPRPKRDRTAERRSARRERTRERQEKRARAELARKRAEAERAASELAAARAKLESLAKR